MINKHLYTPEINYIKVYQIKYIVLSMTYMSFCHHYIIINKHLDESLVLRIRDKIN